MDLPAGEQINTRPTIAYGGCVVLMPKFDAGRYLTLAQAERANPLSRAMGALGAKTIDRRTFLKGSGITAGAAAFGAKVAPMQACPRASHDRTRQSLQGAQP